MSECKGCNAILKIKILNKGDHLKDFLLYMEDILQSMPGFEDMECTGKSRPRYDMLEYTIYGNISPRECRKAIREIRMLIDEGYNVSFESILDPCSACRCVGLETLGCVTR